MRGLLLKDLYALKKQGRVILALAVFYFILGITTDNISMFSTMVILLCGVLPITTMSYDEHYKWEKYALSMPVSRHSLVLSKYYLGIICGLVATAIVLISTFIMNLTNEGEIIQNLLINAGYLLAAYVFLAIVLPIMFKFGTEKGRMILPMVVVVPIVVIMILGKLGLQLPSDQVLTVLAYCSPLIVMGLLFVSFRISLNIYNKKQF